MQVQLEKELMLTLGLECFEQEELALLMRVRLSLVQVAVLDLLDSDYSMQVELAMAVVQLMPE